MMDLTLGIKAMGDRILIAAYDDVGSCQRKC